jgi:hypothetical protein
MSDLPPLDQSQAYVVVGPNDQRGPYTMELLINEVLAGRLSEATPVWWPGLADWTTMGGHPGVAGELAGRRAASAPAAAPGWADPAPAADPFAQPEADPFARPEADPFAQPEAAADPFAQPGAAEPAADPFAASEPFASRAEEVDIVDAEVVEVDEVHVDQAEVTDPVHHEVFSALVARSAVRAEVESRVDAVNEQLVGAVAAALVEQGFSFSELADVERGTELRFEGNDNDLVTVSLGRATAARAEELREDHVPVTVSYRSGSNGATPDHGIGDHGEVVVAADEWTGQSTSSVSLFLGLGDYLDEHLDVDGPAVVRDIAATVAVLRSRLSSSRPA